MTNDGSREEIAGLAAGEHQDRPGAAGCCVVPRTPSLPGLGPGYREY